MKPIIFLCASVIAGCVSAVADPVLVTIDAGHTNGSLRAIHSCNGGPVAFGGMIDLSERFRVIGFPLTRLHDCGWPNPAVVDIHTIFRDFRDDPAKPENYYWPRTDDYLAAILKTGTRIYYRLGESIEHTQRKYDVHPPADYQKWAEVCAGIVRHYNMGWGGGFHHEIGYWEIWNEPEIRPQMWSGSDEDYYRLYALTAGRLKAEFPAIKVGGPGAASAGDFRNGVFQPAPFVAGFLKYCREHDTPLDFFSWHRYTNDPRELAGRARGVRQMLDSLGFTKAESHLNEWNYLPRNDWDTFVRGTPEARTKWYAEMGSPAGAAFVVDALVRLQDAPVDMTFFYTADVQGFGLFDSQGQLKPVFYGFKAFRDLLNNPVRLPAVPTAVGIAACATGDVEKMRISVLLANFDRDATEVNLQLRGVRSFRIGNCRAFRIDAQHLWSEELLRPGIAAPGELAFTLAMPKASVLLLKFEGDQ